MKERKSLQKLSMWIFAILILVVSAVHLPDAAEAKTLYKGKDGGLSWTISDKGELVIKGSGDYVGYYYDDDMNGYVKDTEYGRNNIPEWCQEKYVPNVYSVVVQATDVTNMRKFFYGMENLESVDLSVMDLSQVTDMSYAFSECYCLHVVRAEFADTSRVEDMSYLFAFCDNLNHLNLSHWDTSSCRNMSEIFAECHSLEFLDLRNFDTSQVTDMSAMFFGNWSLKGVNVSGWDTSHVTDIQNMFYSCYKLRSLDLSSWDTSSVEDAAFAFSSCESMQDLDLSGWNLEKIVNTNLMFAGCSKLESLHLYDWNLLRDENMYAMFAGCEKLRDIGSMDVRDADMGNTFDACSCLSGVITVYGNHLDYGNCFRDAATEDGAELVVNYGGACTAKKCRKIVATRSENSNVQQGRAAGFGVFASVDNVRDGVELTWDAIPLADQILIEKSTDNGKTYATICALDDVDAGSLVDRDVKNGKRYFYRLRAFLGDAEYKNLPARIVWMAPVELKPETFCWKGTNLVIESSKNDKASFYIGWVKQNGSYRYVDTYGKPGFCWDEPKLENGKKYTVCVTAERTDKWYKRSGNWDEYSSAFSKPMTFYYLDAPVMKSLEKLSNASFQVNWKKNGKATGHELEYADNKKMTNGKKVRIKDKATLTRKITKQDSGKKYYVRMRSYKVVGKKTWYSKWSGAVKF